MGDGNWKNTQGKCKGVKFQIVEHKDTIDGLVFMLRGVDLILGMAWLATLDDIKANLQNISMQFKGDPSIGKFLISPMHLLKLIDGEQWP